MSAELFDVCVVGSANLDLVAGVSRLPAAGETVMGHSYAEHAGGKGLNQAVAAARAGARVSFVGAVGHDSAGDALIGVMDANGIDRTALLRVDQPTGRALIGVSDDAENLIIVVSGANQAVRADQVPAAKVMLSQFEVPMEALERAFTAGRARGAITVLNPAPAMQVSDAVLSLCDVVLPNQHEVDLLGGVERLLAAGVRHVVVTLGADGARWYRHDSSPVDVPPCRVTPIDTTGAGDCFSGSMAARLSMGDDLGAALRYATGAAALSTTVAGAVPSMPYRAAVEALLSRDV